MGYHMQNAPDIEYLINSSLFDSKNVRKKTDEILRISAICANICEVQTLMKSSVNLLEDINQNVRTLYENFTPSDYKCSEEANIGLLRAVVTSDFIKDLFLQLLNTDICKDAESLKFYLDTMRRISFDVDIILDIMILLSRTYLTDKNCEDITQVSSVTRTCTKPINYSCNIKNLVGNAYTLANSIELRINKLYANDPIGEPSCLFTPLYSSIQESFRNLNSMLLELQNIFIEIGSTPAEIQIDRWLIDAKTRINTASNILYQVVLLKDSCKQSNLCTGELNFTSALLSFDLIQADIISINALVTGGH